MKAFEYICVVQDYKKNKYTHTLIANTLSQALEMMIEYIEEQDNIPGVDMVTVEDWMPTKVLYIEEVKEITIPELGLQHN